MPRDLVARFAGTAHVSVKVFGTGARERHSSIYRSVGYAALSGHRYLQVIVGLHEGHAARWMGWLSAVQPPGINLANASGIRTSQELVRAIAAVRGVPTRADDRLPIRVPDRLLHRWQQDPEAGQ